MLLEHAAHTSNESQGSKYVTVEPGRPDIPAILNAVADDATVRQWRNGISVSVCGPVALAEEVRESVRQLRTRSQVGGVHLHEE